MPAAPSPRELAELSRAVEVLREADERATRASPWVPHRPHPKQAEFLALTCREALYGGAAGGGKSDALLMAALEYVDVPGYAALILRRTFRDLNQPDAIMARSHEWLRGTAAKWNDRDKRWTFPSGATLTFGYCDKARDVYQYQGAALQFIGFDELTQFAEQQVRYLFSRLRRLKGVNVPLRVRAATNPGGIGHEWVRLRYITPGDPKRPFVAAKLVDNPSLDAEDYRQSLAELDATTRKQLEDGVWVRDSDGLVYHLDEGRNIIDAAPEVAHKVLALDFGATAPTSFTILGWCDRDPTVYALRSWKVAGLAPSDAAAQIQALNKEHQFEAVVGDIGGLGKGYQLENRKRFHVPIEPAEKNNKLGYIALLNGDLEKGLVKIVRGACEQLTKELLELPWNERRTGEAEGFDNHCTDGLLYGWRRCAGFLEERAPPAKTPEELALETVRRIEEADEAEGRRPVEGNWWE